MNETRQLCTVHVAGHVFGIPVTRVQEVVSYHQMAPVPLAPDAVEGLINLRGQIVTAIDLRRRLELPPAGAAARPVNVVVYDGNGVVSLLVDAIGDVIEVDERHFELPPETLQGVARALVRGVHKFSSQLVLELDVDRVVDVLATARTSV